MTWTPSRVDIPEAVLVDLHRRTVLGALVAQATDRGDVMFRIMAERSAAAIVDHDALALL